MPKKKSPPSLKTHLPSDKNISSTPEPKPEKPVKQGARKSSSKKSHTSSEKPTRQKRQSQKSPKASEAVPERLSGSRERNQNESIPMSMKLANSKKRKSSKCLVVGIGASAGGLDSFKRFLEAMPYDSSMGFVLIQHLDPNHESLMADLLSKYTSMPVVEAHDAMPIYPNHVYMIPPNKFIKIADGGLFLDEPTQKRGMRMPIDYFFRSLAEARKQLAVGIVLSGTGSDGSQGLREIKAAGGMTLAQQPDTAEYTGMPQAAIATGLVDFVLPINDMPKVINNYAKHPYTHSEDGSTSLSQSSPDHFKAIISLLRAHTDYDFRCYKKATLNRRIERRMGLRHVKNLQAYLQILRGEPQEIRALFKDLLIGVTHFFRDKEAWQILLDDVICPLVKEKGPNNNIRVWVPGCSTGEEAYSLAILLYDELERQKKGLTIQIFATDLDNDAIMYAREGLYPESIAGDLTSHQLSRFFHQEGDHYKVNKRLRGSVVFAPQNLIGDPPFSNLDIISCRNMLIYLESDMQQKLVSMFHFALRAGGFLFLGNSESIGAQAKSFRVLSKTWRIYRAFGHKQRPSLTNFPIGRRVGVQTKYDDDHPLQRSSDNVSVTELARRVLLDEYAPASVVINADMDVQYFHGAVKQYLDFPSGEATNNLMAMAVQELRPKIRSAIRTVGETGTKKILVVPNITRNGDQIPVCISAYPVPVSKNREPLFLVTFQDETSSSPLTDQRKSEGSPQQRKSPTKQSSAEADVAQQLSEQLEYELQATREDLQSSIEELETSNEELKASNEEVLSMNEELQSTNEELETSREELQSLNEELNTVNTQLEEKVDDLENTNNDLNNLISSTEVATLFLDTQMRIRRFTPAAATLLHVRSNDYGRPIQELASQVKDPTLLDDAKTVMERLQPMELEVQTGGHQYFIRRILPYRTNDNKIEGVVVMYTDMTTIKQSSRQIEIRERQQALAARVGQMALTAKNMQTFFEETLKHIKDTLDVPLIKILQLIDDNSSLLLRAGFGWNKGLVGEAHVDTGSNSQAGFTLSSRGPVIVEHLAKERRFSGPPLLYEHNVVSGMSVVIGSNEAPWGVLGVHTTTQRTFTIDDVNFIQTIAHIFSATITNHRIREQLRRDARRASLIREAASMASEIDSLDDALKGCVDIVCRLTGWAAGHTFLVKQNQDLEPTTFWHLPSDGSLQEFKRITEETRFHENDTSLPGRTSSQRRICWIKNIHHDPDFERTKGRLDIPLKGAFAFPLIANNKTVAVAEFFHFEEMNPSNEFLHTIQILAEQFNRILERRYAKMLQDANQKRLQLMTKAGCVGLWEWNPETDNSEWNTVQYELLGLDHRTPASGEMFFRCVHPEDRIRLREILEQVIKQGMAFDHEFRVMQPDGQIRWLVGRGEVNRSSDNHVVLRGINMDITSRKQAEERLRESNETLEDRIAERTAIAEQRAQQLRDLAFKFADFEEFARQKTAQVMHDDLQQLLVAIRIRIQTETDNSLTWVQEIDRLIEESLASCRSLVTDLSPPVLREKGIQTGLRWLARRAMEQHNLSVQLELSEREPEPDQQVKNMIFRTIQELLFNIVKHSQVKHARLIMEYDDHGLRITTEDEGQGFDPLKLRVNRSKGTGFGLFTIQERMMAMGGSVTIDSQPGAGTRISVQIPLSSEASTHGGSGEESSNLTSSVHHQDGRSDSTILRLIVVDDHASVREGFISILNREADIQVVAGAADGQEAIELTRLHRPHAVLMDINMPRMDGIEATRRIKNEQPDISIIGLSMHDTPEIEQAIRDAGATAFIPKGSSAQHLLEAIRQATAQRPSIQ